MMTTAQVAEKLVEYVRAGTPEKAWEELYSPDVVSVEANPDSPDVQGLVGLKAKSEKRDEMAEVHSISVSEPLLSKHYFVVTYDMDVTYKQWWVRSTEDEIAIYEVKDGKIIREEYVYHMADMSQ